MMTQANATANEKVSVVPVVEIEDNDDDYFADVGFMFESQQPVRFEKFRWDIPTRRRNDAEDTNGNDDGHDNSVDDTVSTPRALTTTTTTIQIALHVADDHPGAVQSGHYLWPAARMLSEYLIKRYSFSYNDQNYDDSNHPKISTVIELGAGCAMVSFVALQLWKETLECICITDHDPSTLVRARDNYETTMQQLFHIESCQPGSVPGIEEEEEDNCDEQLNTIINTITNIPVLFESLKWGDRTAVDKLLHQTLPERMSLDMLFPTFPQEHHTTNETVDREKNHHHFDIVLGSDLIYCKEVVRPLFTTAVQLMHSTDSEGTSYFVLAQSFEYDTPTENEIDDMCMEFQLQRTIIVDFDSDDNNDNTATIGTSGNTTTAIGKGRIQEFCFKNRIIV